MIFFQIEFYYSDVRNFVLFGNDISSFPFAYALLVSGVLILDASRFKHVDMREIKV